MSATSPQPAGGGGGPISGTAVSPPGAGTASSPASGSTTLSPAQLADRRRAAMLVLGLRESDLDEIPEPAADARPALLTRYQLLAARQTRLHHEVDVTTMLLTQADVDRIVHGKSSHAAGSRTQRARDDEKRPDGGAMASTVSLPSVAALADVSGATGAGDAPGRGGAGGSAARSLATNVIISAAVREVLHKDTQSKRYEQLEARMKRAEENRQVALQQKLAPVLKDNALVQQVLKRKADQEDPSSADSALKSLRNKASVADRNRSERIEERIDRVKMSHATRSQLVDANLTRMSRADRVAQKSLLAELHHASAAADDRAQARRRAQRERTKDMHRDKQDRDRLRATLESMAHLSADDKLRAISAAGFGDIVEAIQECLTAATPAAEGK